MILLTTAAGEVFAGGSNDAAKALSQFPSSPSYGVESVERAEGFASDNLRRLGVEVGDSSFESEYMRAQVDTGRNEL